MNVHFHTNNIILIFVNIIGRKYVSVALFFHSHHLPGPRFYLLPLFLASALIIDNLFSTEQLMDFLIK